MSGWYWLGMAALLGLTELAVPGVYLAFLAAAAALTGVLALITVDTPSWAQLACFALSSVAAVTIGRRVYQERPVPTADPLLNDRIERLIGTIVTVEQPIVDGHGRVRVGDGAWPAIGLDLPVDARARVIGHDAGALIIEALTLDDARTAVHVAQGAPTVPPPPIAVP